MLHIFAQVLDILANERRFLSHLPRHLFYVVQYYREIDQDDHGDDRYEHNGDRRHEKENIGVDKAGVHWFYYSTTS
jgi:hypothetical protein